MGVIVPARTPAPYLEAALQAILAQEPAPAEVVVVDDGSWPPLALGQRWARRCRLVRRERNGGPAAARQDGLVALDRGLVALADADDLWRPGKLAVQLAALARHADAALCFGRAEVVGPDDRPTGERFVEPPAGVIGPSDAAPWVIEHNCIPTSSVVIRRAALDRAGGFAAPAPLASDWDLWLRLLERGERFVVEPGARIGYRRHRHGVTADTAALAESELAIQDAHLGLIGEDARRRLRARSLLGLAHGRVRQRRWADARAALRDSGALVPLPASQRVYGALTAVPGARDALARRAPYGP